MAGYFEAAPDGTAAATLERVEISILRTLTVQLLELLGPGTGPADAGDDPLAELFTEGPSAPPDDPVLARLLPSAYDDPDRPADPASRAASAEFRRYTENDLRAAKRDDALAVVHDLDTLTPGPDGTARLTLPPDRAPHWLRALNDLRLTLGTILDVGDDPDREFDRIPDDDPRKPYTIAYLWLGSLQDSLVEIQLP